MMGLCAKKNNDDRVCYFKYGHSGACYFGSRESGYILSSESKNVRPVDRSRIEQIQRCVVTLSELVESSMLMRSSDREHEEKLLLLQKLTHVIRADLAEADRTRNSA